MLAQELAQHVEHPMRASGPREVERAVQARLRVDFPYNRQGVVGADAFGVCDLLTAPRADADVVGPFERRGAGRVAFKVVVGSLVERRAVRTSGPVAQNVLPLPCWRWPSSSRLRLPLVLRPPPPRFWPGATMMTVMSSQSIARPFAPTEEALQASLGNSGRRSCAFSHSIRSGCRTTSAAS